MVDLDKRTSLSYSTDKPTQPLCNLIGKYQGWHAGCDRGWLGRTPYGLDLPGFLHKNLLQKGSSHF